MNNKVYKWLDGKKSCHGGTGSWKVGVWRSVKGDLVACENGLHLCRRKDLIEWIGPTLWIAEYDGEHVADGNKIVVRRARIVEQLVGWNEKTARLFAADCAERALPIYEKHHPNDDRTRKCIEATRALARGEIGKAELAAARDAAWDAARYVARDAAWDAAMAAAREDAAWDAASAAARFAVPEWDVWDAERKWQTQRLLAYVMGRLS